MRKPLLLAAALSLLSAAGLSHARAQDGIAGAWQGEYVCAQGRTGVTLTIRPAAGSQVEGLFRFYATASNPNVPEGCFEMAGTYKPGTRQVELAAGQWLLRPPSFVSVDLLGTVSADGAAVQGRVFGPLCTRFELRRIPAAPRAAAPACLGPDVVASVTGSPADLPRR